MMNVSIKVLGTAFLLGIGFQMSGCGIDKAVPAQRGEPTTKPLDADSPSEMSEDDLVRGMNDASKDIEKRKSYVRELGKSHRVLSQGALSSMVDVALIAQPTDNQSSAVFIKEKEDRLTRDPKSIQLSDFTIQVLQQKLPGTAGTTFEALLDVTIRSGAPEKESLIRKLICESTAENTTSYKTALNSEREEVRIATAKILACIKSDFNKSLLEKFLLSKFSFGETPWWASTYSNEQLSLLKISLDDLNPAHPKLAKFYVHATFLKDAKTARSRLKELEAPVVADPLFRVVQRKWIEGSNFSAVPDEFTEQLYYSAASLSALVETDQEIIKLKDYALADYLQSKHLWSDIFAEAFLGQRNCGAIQPATNLRTELIDELKKSLSDKGVFELNQIQFRKKAFEFFKRCKVDFDWDVAIKGIQTDIDDSVLVIADLVEAMLASGNAGNSSTIQRASNAITGVIQDKDRSERVKKRLEDVKSKL